MRTSTPGLLVVVAVLLSGCSSNGGTTGAGGSGATGGAAGTGGTIFVNSDAGAFVPSNAQSCVQPDGGTLLCNRESCCMSLVLPGGTFPQGRSLTGTDQCPRGMTCGSDEVPEFSSTVSTFALDKYEVTVGRLRKFVNAYVSNTATVPADGAGANPAIPGTGWQGTWNTNLPATQTAFKTSLNGGSAQTWTDNVGANEDKAINYVNWYEAFAFCIWDGGRLPTESEWEYAAAGGSENRLYPWGSATPDCTYANFYNRYSCSGAGGLGSVVAVGSTPAGNGKWGHADLAGNALECTFDCYGAYPVSAIANYANISGGSNRVYRGGDFPGNAGGLCAAYRGNTTPGDHSFVTGVRCARTAQ